MAKYIIYFNQLWVGDHPAEFWGGLTIIDVETDEEANQWGAKVAIACGWPQEVRKFKG